jgi:hypothetical protein
MTHTKESCGDIRVKPAERVHGEGESEDYKGTRAACQRACKPASGIEAMERTHNGCRGHLRMFRGRLPSLYS